MKIAEIKPFLKDLSVTIETLDSYPTLQEPEETGRTFAANARLKAIYYSGYTNRLSVAEDSGLEIDALDGEPGVLSARFNGNSYPEKFSAIYRKLKERGITHSRARFVCALALVDGDQIKFETSGTVEGEIASEPRGDHGFGYDPIFFYPPYGRTFAEIDATKKKAVSHRGRAFLALRTFLGARPFRT